MSDDNKIGLHKEQIKELTAKTPKASIQSRPSPWGGEIEYVTGEYVKRKLMSAFKGALRVTVRDIETVEDCILTHITVEYPITQFCKNGTFIHEEWARIDEVGTSTIRKQGQTTNYSTAIKASHTDALKRAATHLGIGLDLYEKTSVMEDRMRGHEESLVPKTEKKVPDWVQPQQAPAKPKPAHTSSSFGGSQPATDKQKSYLSSLAKRLGQTGPSNGVWLSGVTGIPKEQFENGAEKLGKNEASSAIEVLREMLEEKNQ